MVGQQKDEDILRQGEQLAAQIKSWLERAQATCEGSKEDVSPMNVSEPPTPATGTEQPTPASATPAPGKARAQPDTPPRAHGRGLDAAPGGD